MGVNNSRHLLLPNPLYCNRLLHFALHFQGVVVAGEGGAVDVAAGAAHGADVAVFIDDLAARDGDGVGALDLHAFEDVEIHFLVVGLGGDFAGLLRVPHNDIRVCADGDIALARIDVENLGRVRAGDGDEFVHR